MNVAIVGATGAVGKEMIKCLDALKFPVDKLRLVTSERSAGRVIATPFGDITCELASDEVFRDSDIALFSAGGDISKMWRERVVNAGCLMIDNSSAFRYEKDVPLVVPEINADSAYGHSGVISNPNCTTAIAAVVLWPLYRKFGLKRVIVSTYQATSGAGAKGMQELIDQTRAVLKGADNPDDLLSREMFDRLIRDGDSAPEVFAHPIAFNIIPHIDSFQENGYTREEMKVAWETRKIFDDDSLAISCTAVRIPTLRAHSESIVIETEKPVSVEAASSVLLGSLGVTVCDDPAALRYPMPINASGKFDVEVGRIRQNPVFGEYGLEFFISGDQLLKGAALNAVQIALLFADGRGARLIKGGKAQNGVLAEDDRHGAEEGAVAHGNPIPGNETKNLIKKS